MTHSPLVIWRLTDGKPGHMQQTLGLVRALAALTPCNVIDMDLARQLVGWRDFLRGRFPPGEAHEKPQLVIGAGHATHWGLLAARRAAGGRAVVLMKPSLPACFFDAVIAPQHDGMTENARVLNTLGVLNPMQAGLKKPGSLLMLIGGPSKHVQWDDAVMLAQIDAVVTSLAPGSDWRITDSRRTPDSLRAALLARWGEHFQPFAQCPSGWLAGQLAATESVWVSEDSVSMVYEALTAGCRVGLFTLPETGRTSRVMQGVQALVVQEKVTRFPEWSMGKSLPPPAVFDEAKRAAAWLLSH